MIRLRFRLKLRTLLLLVAAFAIMLGVFDYLFISELRPQPPRSTDWRLVRTLEGQSEVRQLEFSPDGNTLAAGHADGVVYLWDLSNNYSRVMLQLTGPINSIAFSPDSKWIAAASDSDSIVNIWDVATGKFQHALHYTEGVSSVDFSPSGMMVGIPRWVPPTVTAHLAAPVVTMPTILCLVWKTLKFDSLYVFLELFLRNSRL